MPPKPGGDASGRQNLVQLIELRWIALLGQLLTIAVVAYGFGIRLPLQAMSLVLLALLLLNLTTTYRVRALSRIGVGNVELLAGLLADVAALTALLYFSGGVTNPFIFLYPLQVTLGAVLLEGWAQWFIVATTTLCFGGLSLWYVPLALPNGGVEELFELHVIGLFVCFVLDATLLAVFISRINRNFRLRDQRLAAMRQRAAEEDNIVRMGLLASGAAHELGTPMATMAVILGDWQRMDVFRNDPELNQEVGDMQNEVQRCKQIVNGILRSAGEAPGEASAITTVRGFLDETVDEWRTSRSTNCLVYEPGFSSERTIVSDAVLKQVIHNLLDNAQEASPDWIGMTGRIEDYTLHIAVRDRGPGFTQKTLEQLGTPYNSSKGRPGGGLGLFLVFNVVRKLGGRLNAENRAEGGAAVTLALPLAAISTPDHGTD
ncbi:ATP-binding protein [Arhodomonas aquaeolei]|uniref:ATP-binding protein n=1 Tax=Arhodomonas aquaeolei TaxID=2369 RepID=UPI000361DB19|nr:ATP-binding protein [Arhodomonas aquaeolei]